MAMLDNRERQRQEDGRRGKKMFQWKGVRRKWERQLSMPWRNSWTERVGYLIHRNAMNQLFECTPGYESIKNCSCSSKNSVNPSQTSGQRATCLRHLKPDRWSRGTLNGTFACDRVRMYKNKQDNTSIRLFMGERVVSGTGEERRGRIHISTAERTASANKHFLMHVCALQVTLYLATGVSDGAAQENRKRKSHEQMMPQQHRVTIITLEQETHKQTTRWPPLACLPLLSASVDRRLMMITGEKRKRKQIHPQSTTTEIWERDIQIQNKKKGKYSWL